MNFYYDKQRAFYLALVTDQQGTQFVFNCPTDTKPTAKAILKHGELISFKEAGKPYRRMDSRSDLFSRHYLKLTPIPMTDAPAEKELLEERRKSAPLIGKETKHDPPLVPEPPKAAASAPPAPPAAPEPKPELKPEPEPAAAPLVSTENFNGRPVYRTERNFPYLLAEKTCGGCTTKIKGIQPVSEMGGKFTRAQMYKPIEMTAPAPGSNSYYCEKCATARKLPLNPGAVNYLATREAPITAETAANMSVKDKKIAALSKARAVSMANKAAERAAMGGTVIKGIAGLVFMEKDGKFFHGGNEILTSVSGTRYVLKPVTCHRCLQKPITLRATVSFRDGKPWSMSSAKPTDQKAVADGRHWVCEQCLNPAPVVQEEPPGIELSEVTTDLAPEPQPAAAPEPQPAAAPAPPAPPPVAQAQPVAAPPAPAGTGGVNALNRLEQMALDPKIDDRVFRGAAWMLARALGGKR